MAACIHLWLEALSRFEYKKMAVISIQNRLILKATEGNFIFILVCLRIFVRCHYMCIYIYIYHAHHARTPGLDNSKLQTPGTLFLTPEGVLWSGDQSYLLMLQLLVQCAANPFTPDDNSVGSYLEQVRHDADNFWHGWAFCWISRPTSDDRNIQILFLLISDLFIISPIERNWQQEVLIYYTYLGFCWEF